MPWRRSVREVPGRSLATVEFLNGTQPAHDLTYDDVFMVPSRSGVIVNALSRPGMTSSL